MSIWTGANRLPSQAGHDFSGGMCAELVSFARAVIEHDCAAAWTSAAPIFDEMVRTTIAHDPEKGDLSDDCLPALCCYVTGHTTETKTETIDAVVKVALLWVFPTSDQFEAAERRGVFKLLADALGYWIPKGRHPAWVALGDTDPKAATWGSSLYQRCKALQMGVTAKNYSKVDLGDGMEPLDAAMFEVTLRQESVDDLSGMSATVLVTSIPGGGTTTRGA